MRRKLIIFLAIGLFLAGLFVLRSRDTPRLGSIYSRAASQLEAERNPVIVVPGILGSKLVDPESGKVVWGAFGGDFIKPSTPEGARLASVPMDEDTPIDQITSPVVPDGALDRFKFTLWFLNFRLSAYHNILRALGVGGYKDEDIDASTAIDYGGHFTCFQFDYDWRLDMSANAKRLDEFIKSRHAYVKNEIARRFGEKDVEIKFNIVAHSMGGILSRYYLRYGSADLPNEGPLPSVTWEGAQHVKSLIMVGTPNAGSLAALKQLIEGFGDIPFAPGYDPVLLGTMPALYQLLPQSRHRALLQRGDGKGASLDIYDPELWIKLGWGLASPDADKTLKVILPKIGSAAERRRIALVHLRKNLARAERMWAALNVPARPPPELSLNLFGGDAVPTDAAMEVDLDTGDYEVEEKAAGDGVVLRSSSLMDERMDGSWTSRLRSPITWDRVFFLFTDHLGMTKDPAFTDNILFMLLEEQPSRKLLRRKMGIRGAGQLASPSSSTEAYCSTPDS